jgi:hypothetical protein
MVGFRHVQAVRGARHSLPGRLARSLQAHHPAQNRLIFRKDGIADRGFAGMCVIPWDQVASIEIEGPDSSSSGIAATRLPTWGVFASAKREEIEPRRAADLSHLRDVQPADAPDQERFRHRSTAIEAERTRLRHPVVDVEEHSVGVWRTLRVARTTMTT